MHVWISLRGLAYTIAGANRAVSARLTSPNKTLELEVNRAAVKRRTDANGEDQKQDGTHHHELETHVDELTPWLVSGLGNECISHSFCHEAKTCSTGGKKQKEVPGKGGTTAGLATASHWRGESADLQQRCINCSVAAYSLPSKQHKDIPRGFLLGLRCPFQVQLEVPPLCSL